MSTRYFGTSVSRREDPRLLRGHARYVDDIKLPGLLHAHFVRSLHAHARLVAVRVEAARAQPGVAEVFRFADLADWLKPMPTIGAPPPALEARIDFSAYATPQYPLAHDRVRYVGEPIAVVVARSRAEAEDAAEFIEMDYEPLPAVVDTDAALAPGAPRLFPDVADNVALRFTHAIGDTEAALQAADVVVRERFRVHRYTGTPLECRGMVVEPHPVEPRLTMWDATQFPHVVQKALIEVLGWPAHRIRVVAPDVGGGFGVKAMVYPEEMLVPLVAVQLGKPVKWIEDRREHLLAAIQSREQVHDIDIAAMHDGRIVAVRDRFRVDMGAYNACGIIQPYNTVAHMMGLFRIRHFAVEAQVVLTNKMLHAPYRGAGRPAAVFAMDRAVDRLAQALDLDPAELRRRNFIQAEEMPSG